MGLIKTSLAAGLANGSSSKVEPSEYQDHGEACHPATSHCHSTQLSPARHDLLASNPLFGILWTIGHEDFREAPSYAKVAEGVHRIHVREYGVAAVPDHDWVNPAAQA
eukprot:CAMPEP_0184388230 /NCGR_PEP_ID=MMETSP0007-20130409/11430_1 /TAXON_ID=97485 /ORGANISM="Prymnesium parvum, Strain Texoma1" /LENGTH=107 /DNA_ID=CAMNT_0026736977 /DNA_START=115 /DNA_END=440 /DNA_ORIENTATION=+